jgi:hypothetical protein
LNDAELLWRLRSGKPKTIKQLLQRIHTQENEKLLSTLVEKGAVALNNGKYIITPQGAKLIDEKYMKKERKRKETNKETNVKAEILAYDDMYKKINKLSSEVTLIKNFVEGLSKEIYDMKKMITSQAESFR